MDVLNKNISVIGAALSGIAVAGLLKRKGARVFLSESAPQEQKSKEYVLLQNENMEFEFGGHSDRVLNADWVVVSPGVPGDIPILRKLAVLKIPVYSEIEVASRFLRSPIIAITGSNGKTTTTALIGEICRKSGLDTIVAGNIGTPLSDVVETSAENGIAVLEISSFQAERLTTFKPKVGILLNLSPDHMDRYSSVEEYYRAKRKTFEMQDSADYLIYNDDDGNVKNIIAGLGGTKIPFSLNRKSSNGCYLYGGRIMCQLEKEEEVITTDWIGIIGKHNFYNAMAAILAARLIHIPVTTIRRTLHEFRGVDHRLEFVKETRGVRFYNDSKATNVDSTYVALESFTAEKIILIAGGKHKGAPYTPLRELTKQKVKCLVLMGEAAPLIEKDMAGVVPVIRAQSMHEAVQKSFEQAVKGDVILLSPACSSYDMFKNYEDRGNQFKQEIFQLN
ncbi:UDP-N-acetylmuramoyl-L-alanine--D-glutamate ligase [bacterium]|nr:UDP-N-acetylmuramoyl-L-alanine--D-glutamate ligase [bacterium]